MAGAAAAVLAWSEGLGPYGLLVFALLATLSAMSFVPRPVLCTAGGFAYGLAAVPVVMAGATLGAAAAFLIARHLLRSRFERVAAGRPAVRAVTRAVDLHGWKVIALLRVSSPVPSSLLSYAFGLTRVRLNVFAAATFLGIAPQVLLFVLLGMAGESLIERRAGGLEAGILVVGLLLTGLATLLVGRTARALLRAGDTPP